MTVYVVTDHKKTPTAFAAIGRSRSYDLEFAAPGQIKSIQEKLIRQPQSIMYFDVNGLSQATVVRRVKAILDSPVARLGVVDPADEIKDVAQLFHLGVVDYLGRSLCASGLTTARLRKVLEFCPACEDGVEDPGRASGREKHWVPSGSDWSNVQSDREYTFLMVYAGIDDTGELHRKAGETLLATMRATFQSLLDRNFQPHGGKPWMWKEDDGLFLVPFDGQTVDAVIPALRLMINRVLINIDVFSQIEGLSWRLALHLGNSTYRESGHTGDIVSEDVNFVYHLGERFLGPGELALTGDCHRLLPQAVQRFFVPRGRYESVDVYTLRELV